MLYACCLHQAARDAAPVVLAGAGWAAANAQQRARLALLWVENTVGAPILREGHASFTAANRTFAAPEAQPLPDGGLRVRVWVRYESMDRMDPGGWTCALREVVFRPDGSIGSSETPDRFECQEPRSPSAPVPVQDVSTSGRVLGDLGAPDGLRANFAGMMRVRRSALRRCQEAALRQHPGLGSGSVTLEVTVDPSGAISRATVVADTVGDEGLATCLTGVVTRFRFNQGPANAETFQYQPNIAP